MSHKQRFTSADWLGVAMGRMPALFIGHGSMTCYGLDAELCLQERPHGAATLPEGVPPEQTNM